MSDIGIDHLLQDYMPLVIGTKIRANAGKTLRSARTAGVNYVDGIRAMVL
jgi:hypothetical protein